MRASVTERRQRSKCDFSEHALELVSAVFLVLEPGPDHEVAQRTAGPDNLLSVSTRSFLIVVSSGHRPEQADGHSGMWRDPIGFRGGLLGTPSGRGRATLNLMSNRPFWPSHLRNGHLILRTYNT